MDERFVEFRENLDKLLSDLNGRAEEVKENFRSFQDVFGKEWELQSENLKKYRSKMESRAKKLIDREAIANDIREELDHVVRDLRSSMDRVYDVLKDRIAKAR